MNHSRRQFVTRAGMALASAPFTAGALRAMQASSPFRVAVINDEISPDFEHACSVASKDFGMQWIELRSAWGKNLQQLGDDQLAQMETILKKYSLRVTDIGSPLGKVDWPGAKRANGKEPSANAQENVKKQDEVLEKSIAHGKRFGTDIVRCFDFFRLADPKPQRAAINDVLQRWAEAAGKQNMRIALENEFECNTATGREAAETLSGVSSAHLGLNWDPGNAVRAGELDAYPVAWKMLPKNRIIHCHVKNTIKGADGKLGWSPVDKGYIDWAAQFRDLKATGYHGAVSLETHWNGAPTHEESTRISWAGMKKCLQEASAL